MRHIILIAALVAALPALAVNAPTAVAPQPEKISVSWALPTTRENSALLTPAERKQVNLYASWLPAVVSIPEAGTTYVFTLAPGVCVTQADKVDATEVDITGLESAPVTAKITWSACGPQALPAAPAGVTLTRTH